MMTMYAAAVCVVFVCAASVASSSRWMVNPNEAEEGCEAGFRRPTGSDTCERCTRCRHGFGATQVCLGDRDTLCELCEEGVTFSRSVSYWQQCHKCKTCEHSETTRQCQPTRNTQCGRCNKGWYKDPLTDRCEECSYCHPELPGRTFRVPECNVSGVRLDYQCFPIMVDP